MFNIFRKKKKQENKSKKTPNFEIELTASVLAYEVARSDGDISYSELALLLDEVKKVSNKAGKKEEEILETIKIYSENSVSFYEFIDDINNKFLKEDKHVLIKFLYDVAFADKVLEVNEERLIRRIANMINIKDVEVLKLKDESKNNK